MVNLSYALASSLLGQVPDTKSALPKATDGTLVNAKIANRDIKTKFSEFESELISLIDPAKLEGLEKTINSDNLIANLRTLGRRNNISPNTGNEFAKKLFQDSLFDY